MNRDPWTIIASRLGARLVRRRPLTGGVCADIAALDVERDGHPTTVVVRQHDPSMSTPSTANMTTAEHALLELLHDLRFPFPKPLLLDNSATILPGPYLVLPFVEGTKELAHDDLATAFDRMADFLTNLHALDVEGLELPDLPDRFDPVSGIAQWLPSVCPAAWMLVEPHLDLLELRPNRTSLLHGDFWTGNILWRDGTIAAVIDWEDAALGDPISDLAGARVELLWALGADAVTNFTERYIQRSALEPSPTHLALWDLYVGSAALTWMGGWGLDAEVEAENRRRTDGFLRQAATVLHEQ